MRGGGQVRYVTNLAQELARLGHRVTIGCKQGGILVEKAAEAGAQAHDRFAFKGGLRPNVWRHDIAEMRRFMHLHKPDILHVNGSQDHWIAALANGSLGRPACLLRTRHNTYPVKDHIANRVLNRRWTGYQIVVCDVVRETLAKQRTFDGDRMCSIHNGVDAERFQPNDEARHTRREEFGYDTNTIVCGIAARLVRDKGHAFLFQAAAKLKDNFPELRILVLGEGPLESELKSLAESLGIAELVHFAGFRDDMDQCVQAVDIGAQPSIGCDTSSFTLKEQMAAEKPVVTSDYGGLTEIVQPEIEGFVVPSGTVDPLAEALKKLLSNAGLRNQMGEAGRRRVLAEFTVQVFASRTVEAYRRAMEVHRERLAH
jgi:glycosyltransferase involved in cell wall biosynthesis